LVRIERVQVLVAEHRQDGRIAEPFLRQPGVQLTIMVVLQRRSAPRAMGRACRIPTSGVACQHEP
jgi:hypothetical protein